ncbi:MAG: glycosyltransferase [Proteobacteria bacterium]|nr:MAG: glycosyltransferase [Pseudomonadota bacterium]QKK10239.1 MAG: glycosyltransferase family 4 protein [Pseudomonadota bacterium]
MRVLFYDALTSFAYDAELMAQRGIGGTESTVVRIAEGLSTAHEVVVAQRARILPVSPHPGLRYVPLEEPDPFCGPPPDWVIVLRKHKLVPKLRARFPLAAMVSWIHNWQRAETAFQRIGLARSRCSVVTVSDAHCRATDRLINGKGARALGALWGGGGIVPVKRIYNPVDDRLMPDGTPVDPDKLIFFSTANKGLNQALTTFSAIRKVLPSLQLYVAGESLESLEQNKRYDSALLSQPGVHLLGRLAQHEVFKHVREALCVFYPQNVHPETFGLVFAESNALGTPVLAHEFGSAREILGGPEQLVDAGDVRSISAKLQRWRNGNRPLVSLSAEFRTTTVVGKWREFLVAGLPEQRN